MRQTKEFTVSGQAYKVTQLGAVEGFDFWVRIGQAVAEGITALAKFEQLDEEAALQSVAAIVKKLDRDTFKALRSAFGKTSSYKIEDRWPDLTDTNFDDHFAGKYMQMTQWFGHCLHYNFFSFLSDSSEGKAMADKLAELAKSWK